MDAAGGSGTTVESASKRRSFMRCAGFDPVPAVTVTSTRTNAVVLLKPMKDGLVNT